MTAAILFDLTTHSTSSIKPSYLEKWNATVYRVLHLVNRQHSTAIVENSNCINITHLSSSLAATSGVPQESILGPTLVLFFVNDLHRYLKNYLISQYIDDTTCDVSETFISAVVEAVNGVVTNMTTRCIKKNLG